jgi:hypothetical protein
MQEDLAPGKMIFIDKKSNIVKDNTLTLTMEEQKELAKVLRKYKQS